MGSEYRKYGMKPTRIVNEEILIARIARDKSKRKTDQNIKRSKNANHPTAN
jgi:hypothetical protein